MLHIVRSLHARVLCVRYSGTQDSAFAKGDRQYAPTLHARHRQNPERTFPYLDRASHQDARSLTNGLHHVAVHGHGKHFSLHVLSFPLIRQIYGYLYLLFTTYPRIFKGNYGFTEKTIGTVYLGSGVGSFVGIFIMGFISDRVVTAMTKRNGGKPKPEYRLPLMMAGALIIPIGLFIYGWTAEKKVHYIVPIIGTALLGAGMMMTFVRMHFVEAELWLMHSRCLDKPISSTCTPSTRLRCRLPRRCCARF
jgi:hypothetical protein